MHPSHIYFTDKERTESKLVVAPQFPQNISNHCEYVYWIKKTSNHKHKQKRYAV